MKALGVWQGSASAPALLSSCGLLHPVAVESLLTKLLPTRELADIDLNPLITSFTQLSREQTRCTAHPHGIGSSRYGGVSHNVLALACAFQTLADLSGLKELIIRASFTDILFQCWVALVI